ncbi:MAG: 2-hydroxyacyl-CoA dehydratase family protein [Saccharofermentans sp.]|nr:2-hydroxyacyl-CoA dehydratase family protein [Saccharofermentans sp.]
MKILSMSGFVPEAICDTVRFNGFKGDAGFSHYCAYASDYISQVLADDTIDGAVFPKTCDSSRSISSYIGESGKFVYPLAVPVVRSEEAVKYYAYVIRDFKMAVESFYDVKITEEEIETRLEVLEVRRRIIKSNYEDLCSGLSYSSYIEAIHNALAMPLAKQKIEVTEKSEGTPVFLLGSYLTSIDILKTAEKCGLKIVADDLPESGRLVTKHDHPATNDLYEKIAWSILAKNASPTQNDFEAQIARTILQIRIMECKGVLIITQKYCEPYDYYYSVLKKTLDDEGIPSLKIELDGSLDQNLHESELGAFASMLEASHG